MDNTFINTLIDLNRLDRVGVKQWLFYPGMLFRSSSSWWGTGRPRDFTHEGLDLCFFETIDGKRFRLDSSVHIPVTQPGKILYIIDDFIGKTIVWEPMCNSRKSIPICVIYAHVTPENRLKAGDAFSGGEHIARIAPVDPDKTPMPSHLHLSVMVKAALPLSARIDWKYLNHMDRSAFLDPAPLAGINVLNTHMIDFTGDVNVYDDYPVCPVIESEN